MNTKLVVLGIGSLTGYKITSSITDNFDVYGTYNLRNPNLKTIDTLQLDASKKSDIENFIRKIQPDVIINCIALNNVDYCESHSSTAMGINYEFVKFLTDLTYAENCKLVHLSTDSVFDGQNSKPYTENDLPNPINVYGKSKLKGELEVLKHDSNLVVRASVLYGWLPDHMSKLSTSSMKPQNFAQWLIGNLQQKKSVNIITDEYSSPIIADDFAKSILHLIQKNESGLFHSAPQLNINRYEFSIQLGKSLGFDTKLIRPVTNKELGRKVVTAKNKCLDSLKLKKTSYNFLTLEQSFELIKKQMSS